MTFLQQSALPHDETSLGPSRNEKHLLDLHQCEHCSCMLTSRTDLKHHVEKNHCQIDLNQCIQCDQISATHTPLEEHMMYDHTEELVLHCMFCNLAFDNQMHLSDHTTTSHLGYDLFHRITQLDGNDTLDESLVPMDTDAASSNWAPTDLAILSFVLLAPPSTSSFHSSPTAPQVSSASMPAPSLRPTPHQAKGSENIIFNYSLNPLHQAQRLQDNAQKTPMEVTLNNVRMINGEKHPTNAQIECNAVPGCCTGNTLSVHVSNKVPEVAKTSARR